MPHRLLLRLLDEDDQQAYGNVPTTSAGIGIKSFEDELAELSAFLLSDARPNGALGAGTFPQEAVARQPSFADPGPSSAPAGDADPRPVVALGMHRGPLRCLETFHPENCKKCVPAPSPDQYADWELRGDPGQKNGARCAAFPWLGSHFLVLNRFPTPWRRSRRQGRKRCGRISWRRLSGRARKRALPWCAFRLEFRNMVSPDSASAPLGCSPCGHVLKLSVPRREPAHTSRVLSTRISLSLPTDGRSPRSGRPTSSRVTRGWTHWQPRCAGKCPQCSESGAFLCLKSAAAICQAHAGAESRYCLRLRGRHDEKNVRYVTLQDFDNHESDTSRHTVALSDTSQPHAPHVRVLGL